MDSQFLGGTELPVDFFVGLCAAGRTPAQPKADSAYKTCLAELAIVYFVKLIEANFAKYWFTPEGKWHSFLYPCHLILVSSECWLKFQYRYR